MSTFLATILLYAQTINHSHMSLTSAKLDATGHHFVASLANYNFALNHQTEKMNVDVDALPHSEGEA